MNNNKDRLFKLIEHYINNYNKVAVEAGYGVGTKIKIHSMSESPSTSSLLFEVVILLGDTINEEVMDREMADVLVRDALSWFFPERLIKTYVRWDV